MTDTKTAVAGEETVDAQATPLVEALKRQDATAFEALVRSYAPKLLAVARRFINNEADAHDCVQETFLAVHRKIQDFEERASLGTWLHRIVVNAALTRLRASKRQAEESLDSLLPKFDTDGYLIGPTSMAPLSADDLLERADTKRTVRTAIDQLPPGYRSVLLLRDIEGFSTQEVADALDIKPGTVKTRLHRARAALKTLLEPIFREDTA